MKAQAQVVPIVAEVAETDLRSAQVLPLPEATRQPAPAPPHITV